MQVVGYIREASADSEPAFAQSEQIRRWIGESGHRLVSLCQDVRSPGHSVGREGLQSIVGIVSAGQVDAVVVPSLLTFSQDKVSQEVIMWELRAHGVMVLSTDSEDIPQLADPPADQVRLIIRDVLAKSARFEEIMRLPTPEVEPDDTHVDEARDVVIELIPPDPNQALPQRAVRPATWARPKRPALLQKPGPPIEQPLRQCRPDQLLPGRP